MAARRALRRARRAAPRSPGGRPRERRETAAVRGPEGRRRRVDRRAARACRPLARAASCRRAAPTPWARRRPGAGHARRPAPRREPASRSVPPPLVDHVHERLAAEEAAQVLAEEVDGSFPVARAQPRDVRRQDGLRQAPQRTLARKGLVLENVETRPGDPPGSERLRERGLVDELPAAE